MLIWEKQLITLNKFTILCVLVFTITGCGSFKNIRPETITPNFQSTITVMSFNIRHGCGRESWGNTTSAFFRGCEKKYDEIVAAIRSADPDVVGLQEVNRGQAGIIAKALNMNYSYSTHNGSGYGSYWGNAVLSKFKLSDSRKISIGGSAGRNRSMVSATAIVNDLPIAFISVHTDHRLMDSRSIKRILNYTNTINIPAVLIGDFNMSPGSPHLEVLLTGTGFIDSAGPVPYGVMGTWDREVAPFV